ncbi:MAG TPA: multidrug transporter, partial [Hydrogenophaga sp.]|nr:multidrug transporter [Hydrogenophaga sp.]
MRRGALALAVLTLAGCSFIPTYERPAAPVAAEWSGVTPVAAATPAAEVAWADFVSDARLRELIGLAIKNNRDLRVATLNIEQVR